MTILIKEMVAEMMRLHRATNEQRRTGLKDQKAATAKEVFEVPKRILNQTMDDQARWVRTQRKATSDTGIRANATEGFYHQMIKKQVEDATEENSSPVQSLETSKQGPVSRPRARLRQGDCNLCGHSGTCSVLMKQRR